MSSVSAVDSLVNGTATNTNAIDLSSVLGAISGNTPALDVTSAVAAAIYAARAPERVWQADQTTLTSQTTALQAIQTATTAVSNDLNALNSLNGPLAARTVTSSSANVTATAATGTVAGTHSVTVNSLATTGSWYSDVAANPTTTLPSSSLTITVAGTATTIATGSGAAGDTLADLATTINADKLGVTASVVNDATGSRLAIIASASGAAADFSITSPNYTGTSWTSPNIPTGDTLGANSFTLAIGVTTTTITTTAGETYAQLAADINTRNLGVTATAGSSSSGTNLTIASNDSTTPFTISEPNFGFTQATVGADANLSVDGVPIDSASNTVTGAISGVTLTLLGQSAVPVNLTVASDASGVSTAINQFVTDYNTALGLVHDQFSVSSTGYEGVLAGDSLVTSLQSTLEQAISYQATPATGTTTTVASLSALGITQSSDGTLSVDTTALNSALINNPGDVQNFFAGSALNGFASSLSASLNTYTDPVQGAFTVDLSGISKTSSDITSRINDFETNYIATQQTLLTAKFNSAEAALQALPNQLAQIQAELGNNSKGNG